ncbi:MAG: hypothetical protein QFB86_02100 [Patescibacteria group bacterium]|nr:hypothetical protein [Patescibacteria group bacterium]
MTDEAAKSAVKAYRFVRPENFEETEQADNAKLSAVGGTAVRRCTTNAQAFERNGKQEECAVVKLRSSILMPDLPPKSPK